MKLRLSHQEKQLLMKKFSSKRILEFWKMYIHIVSLTASLKEFSDKIRGINKYVFGHHVMKCVSVCKK